MFLQYAFCFVNASTILKNDKTRFIAVISGIVNCDSVRDKTNSRTIKTCNDCENFDKFSFFYQS